SRRALRDLPGTAPADIAQQFQRRDLVARTTGNSAVADQRLERILAGNDLTDISYLALGLIRARAVGRITIRSAGRLTGYGTGFLVAPGVLLTNQHVFPSAQTAAESLLQLNYQRSVTGRELTPATFSFRTDPAPVIHPALDFALVAVDSRSAEGTDLTDFGWLTLNPEPGKAFIGEYLTIIQHPRGEPQQICVRENRLLKYAAGEPWVWYQTDTVGGSSGSPVFNTSWDVVALHHQAVPRVSKNNVPLAKNGRPWTAAMGDAAIDWIANEGIRISSILQWLTTRHGSHPLVQAVNTAGQAPLTETQSPNMLRPATDHTTTVTRQADGQATIVVPLTFDLRLQTPHPAVPATPAPQTPPAANDRPDVAESVRIDRTSYHLRNGYQPDFPGQGCRLQLPEIAGNRFGRPLTLQDGTTELKYWNYSVIMNQDRSLAFFSAANIRPREQKTTAQGTDFIRDLRVDEVLPQAQLDHPFYAGGIPGRPQDRTGNPFDRGHLTRREDLQWGTTPAEARRNGDDSFHFTNCVPQHHLFNQNSQANGLWNRLETMAVRHLTDADNLCIINGPVFNAPASRIDRRNPALPKILKLQLTARRRLD
ncbi:MAG: DNA/RNA non-specific endonuclease, partial [Planctomycetaceae bacterium]